MLSFQGLADLENKEWFEQLPFIVAVSVAAGLLGAMFNKAHKWIFKASSSRVLIQDTLRFNTLDVWFCVIF